MDKFGLSKETIKMFQKFFMSFDEISEVRIFGSRARGDFKSGSDIDLALIGEIDAKLLRHVAFGLDELPSPYKFDVVNYNDIDNNALKQNIDNEGQVFYKKFANY